MSEIICGDCLDILPTLPADYIIVTDPPYGCNNDCDYTRFSGGLADGHGSFAPIVNNDKPFDPKPLLRFSKAIVWGYQFFADKLPQGTVLVWLKKRDNQLATILSDCELAWQSGGKGVYLFRHIWNGFDRESERGQKTLHPSQKPIALMRWCIERISKPGDTIVDPYCGAGSTLVAAQQLGRQYIGIDISEHCCHVARERLRVTQPVLL